MSVLVDLTTPISGDVPDSTPRRILQELPSATLEVVHVGQDGLLAIPYLWVRGVSGRDFEEALTSDPRIRDTERLDDGDQGTFYKVEWEVDSPLIDCVLHTDGIILAANGDGNAWSLKVWFESNELASRFQSCCHEESVPIEIRELASVTDLMSETNSHITHEQVEAITLAYERGYFEEPRGTTQSELAAELGISTTAFGRRLRRGVRNHLEYTLLDSPG